jgi:acyl-CoA thioesterase FadM
LPHVTVHARWDDADRFGHVNNAAYVALLRDATDRIVQRPIRLEEVSIEFAKPLPPNVDVDVAADSSPEHEGRLEIRYAIAHAGATHATALARWRFADGAAPSLPTLEHDAGGRSFTWTHVVRSFEIGPDATLRPSAALQWFEYAVYRAAERVGWTVARMREADFVTLQIAHHLVLGPPPPVGEELDMVSRLVEMRRVSGVWHHEAVRRAGGLVGADRSRGAFLDSAGRPRRAPDEMIAALLAGDPG